MTRTQLPMKLPVMGGVVWTAVVVVGAVVLFQHIGVTPGGALSDEARLQRLGVGIVFVLALGYGLIWQLLVRGRRRPPHP